jgi:hypothetical protein
VRDFFRAYEIRWPEIARFEMPRTGALRKAGLRIHLIDGRLISATIYGRRQLNTHDAARQTIQELGQLREQYAGMVDPPVPSSPVTKS